MTDESSIARRALALLDLTDLSDDCSVVDVRRLCERAVTAHGSVAAVCVWPRFVREASEILRGSPVEVATVVNFPTGDEGVADVVATTRVAIEDGADEIDLVMPYRALSVGDEDVVVTMLDAVREVVNTPRLLKVILETGELGTPESVARAARLAIDHGADFVKTSTGKSKVSATPEAVSTMLREIAATRRPVGIKPSGGIRTVSDAATFLRLADEIMGEGWATPRTFRFGASGLLDAILEVLDHP